VRNDTNSQETPSSTSAGNAPNEEGSAFRPKSASTVFIAAVVVCGGGIVAYATEVKEAMGVDPSVIAKYGVYSDETAMAMAKAIRERLGADIGIGTTGVAGPEPDGVTPVGEVHIAIDGGGKIPNQALNFTFNGKVTGDTMSGTLDMGEYLKARFTAKRRESRRG